MAMGKRDRQKQTSMWVATHLLPRSAAHPFYTRLNHMLDQHDFDGYVEGLCQRFYADEGRPGLPPGRYFRLLLIGYFEGLDAERAIAWRAADSFAIRDFLGLVLPDAPPDHSTISRTRRLIDLETHEAVFTWLLQRLADAGLVKGKTVGIGRDDAGSQCRAACADCRPTHRPRSARSIRGRAKSSVAPPLVTPAQNSSAFCRRLSKRSPDGASCTSSWTISRPRIVSFVGRAVESILASHHAARA
jgi:transposase